MGSTTPIHALRYPAGGDTPAVPADMGNLALDVDAQLPYVGTSTPTKKPGLVWYNPTADVLQITDGSTWYTINGDTGEQAITPLSGFVSVNSPVARRVGKLVVLSGAIKQSSGAFPSATTNCATLPAGFAPAGTRSKRYAAPGNASATAGSAEVLMSGGSLTIAGAGIGASTDTLYLDGVSYFVS